MVVQEGYVPILYCSYIVLFTGVGKCVGRLGVMGRLYCECCSFCSWSIVLRGELSGGPLILETTLYIH